MLQKTQVIDVYTVVACLVSNGTPMVCWISNMVFIKILSELFDVQCEYCDGTLAVQIQRACSFITATVRSSQNGSVSLLWLITSLQLVSITPVISS